MEGVRRESLEHVLAQAASVHSAWLCPQGVERTKRMAHAHHPHGSVFQPRQGRKWWWTFRSARRCQCRLWRLGVKECSACVTPPPLNHVATSSCWEDVAPEAKTRLCQQCAGSLGWVLLDFVHKEQCLVGR
mmetsp:Transcript_128662/g.324830  ORF Transcript_128662/g.324830 Transcript_128662/m.324830 type:complete len:131 (+) Transcript_128662:198-590(+)